MQALSLFKGATLRGFALLPKGEDHLYSDVGQGTHGHALTLALSPFVPILRLGPRLRANALPGTLAQGVAQGFETDKAYMHCGVVSTFQGTGQVPGCFWSLHTACGPPMQPTAGEPGACPHRAEAHRSGCRYESKKGQRWLCRPPRCL